MFIVGSEAVPEAEWWAMLPSNVSVHAARITAPAPWAKWREIGTGVERTDDMLRGCQQFGAMRLSVVVVGHSSSSFLGGKGWDEAVVDALSHALGSGTIVTTNGLDTLSALHASGVRRPYLVMPPWFNDETMAVGVRYYKDHGLKPAGHLRYDPGPEWRDVPPRDMYPRGMGFEQDVESLKAQIKASCPAEADGVLITGTGFRCVAILGSLEQDLKRPVLSANQASLWRCLQLAGVRSNISGYGTLLRTKN